MSEKSKNLSKFDWAKELGDFHAAGYDPSLLKHSPDEAGLSVRHRSVREELKRLLGPLVPAPLRDAEGALDVSRIKVGSREELFSFLQTQAELNDHSSFSDPYQRLLEDGEFSELLALIYQEIDPDYSVFVSAAEASELLGKFQARLIEVDADHFAQSHLNSSSGRKRIQTIFDDKSHYSLEQRADLAKAVARVSPDWEHFITQKISLWNYWNLGVNEEDVDHASRVAASALNAKDEKEKDFASRRELYLKHPEQVTGVIHLESSTGLKIKPHEIKEMEELRLQGSKSLDPILQVKGKLAGLWLLAADADYFNEPLGEKPYGLNAWMIEKAERLLAKADKIESEEELQKFNEELQDFLKDGIAEPKESQSYTWVKHQFSGQGFKERFESRSPELKAPYEALLTLSDRWKYAQESGEAIFTKKTELKIKDPKLKEAVVSLIQGLEQTKQELWYGYKQHKALSRGISNLANLAKAGDIQDIEGANREIDSLIKKLKNAETAEEVQTQVDRLQELLKEGNALHQGLEAAEMSGGEQLLGFIQTLGTILIAATATRGLSLAAQGSAAVARGPAALSAIRNFITGMTALRPVQGFLWGATMATMENALAVSTGEVRVEKDTIEKWLKDALSTGASMALVTPLAQAGGQSVEKYLLKDLAARYLSHGSKGALNLLSDTGLEAVEEVLDQYVRQALDGNFQALSLGEIQEIAKICLAGGGLQIGAVAMQNKRTGAAIAPAESSFALPTTLKTRRQWMKNPLFAPMWAALSAGGLGGWDPSPTDSEVKTTLRDLEQDLVALRDKEAEGDEITAHYSVIGDFLQSAGDPRGEWIALEIKRQELLDQGYGSEPAAWIENQIHRIRSKIAATIEEDFHLSIRIDFHLEKGFSLVLEGDKSPGATQENWDRFFQSPHASLLEGIELEYFSKDKVWPLAGERLRHLAGLRRLRIHGSQLDQNLASIARSSALSRLESLALTCSGIDEADARAVAESKTFTNLQSLDLSHNGSFRNGGARAIAKSNTLVNLRSLNVSYNFIGEVGAQAIAESKTLGNLQTLHLGNNDIGDAGALAIAESGALANLRSLNLEFNQFGEEGVLAIARSKTLTNLQALDLGINYIGEEGAEAIAGSAALANLRSLKLGGGSIGAEGARAIAQSKVLTNLQALDIADNAIGNAGAQAIAGSSGLTNLQALNLGDNDIGAAGARAIAESNHLINLRYLDLTFNPIDEAATQVIRESKNLPNLIELNGEEALSEEERESFTEKMRTHQKL
ncbi:MAG TPA: hypothetical protein VJR29_03370 [bacterium]|nr:hypothetical protein [bacterium]